MIYPIIPIKCKQSTHPYDFSLYSRMMKVEVPKKSSHGFPRLDAHWLPQARHFFWCGSWKSPCFTIPKTWISYGALSFFFPIKRDWIYIVGISVARRKISKIQARCGTRRAAKGFAATAKPTAKGGHLRFDIQKASYGIPWLFPLDMIYRWWNTIATSDDMFTYMFTYVYWRLFWHTNMLKSRFDANSSTKLLVASQLNVFFCHSTLYTIFSVADSVCPHQAWSQNGVITCH